MGCLGSLPRDHSEGDEYQPVEEETASRPFRRRLVCLFGRRLFSVSLMHRRGIIDRGNYAFCSNKGKYKPFG